MGYSARYHAASLAAVFLALAVGILIGVGFGQDVVSESTESLEQSLKEDLDESRAREEDLGVELEREREFAQRAYPALVGGRLRGETVAVVALGELSEEVAGEIEAALEPTDARLRKVAVVRLPPDLGGVSERLDRPRFERFRQDPARIERLGRAVGRQLAAGGPLLKRAREQLLARFSGRPDAVDRVVVVRELPEQLSSREAEAVERLERGILDGLREGARGVVGVERSDSESSSVPTFEEHGLATVDSVDLTSGKVSTVLALGGAEGDFGIKETADSLLPELLLPSPRGRGPAERRSR